MVSYAQLMKMSKKIKPNELTMINNKSDTANSSTSAKTHSVPDPKTALKRKTSEPIMVEESSKAVKSTKEKRTLISEKPSQKRHNVKPELRRVKKDLTTQSHSAAPCRQSRTVVVDKLKTSSKTSSKNVLERKPHFQLNPYAIDPSDPLIHGDSVNVSSYIGKLFGYSKDRFKDDSLDIREMESSYASMRREEQRSTKIAKKEDLEEELRNSGKLPKNSAKGTKSSGKK